LDLARAAGPLEEENQNPKEIQKSNEEMFETKAGVCVA
jgi:hypothetical protein